MKLKKNIGQSLERNFVLSLLAEGLADLMVLAIDATQVAKPNKDIARAVLSHKRRLFAEVRSVRRNYREQPRITGSDFIVKAINLAIARADAAAGQHLHQCIRAKTKLARFQQLHIRRLVHILNSTGNLSPPQRASRFAIRLLTIRYEILFD